jgi:hypothetical protein
MVKQSKRLPAAAASATLAALGAAGGLMWQAPPASASSCLDLYNGTCSGWWAYAACSCGGGGHVTKYSCSDDYDTGSFTCS